MIKRPLVWILTAFLAGMYLASLRLSILIIILIMFLYFLFVYLLLFQTRKKEKFRKDHFLWGIPVLLLFGFFSMRAQLQNPEVYDAFDREVRCELTGSIVMVVQKKSSTALYLKNDTIVLPNDKSYTCEQVLVSCLEDTEQQNSTADYLVGNKITVKGILQKFSMATNPGQFNEQLYYQIENIDFKMQAEQIQVIDSGYSYYHFILNKLKNRLVQVYSSILSGKEAGALIAMLLGEKYLLEDEIKELYQQNGISHILAISGLHVSLIGMFFFGLLKRLKVPVTAATFLSIFFIYSYGVLTNFSVSTNRAVVMIIVLLLAALVGKTYDMLSAMALSALIILLQNPMQILSAGFLLSYGAVFGIAVILPCLKQLFPSKNTLLNSLLISTSAQLSTAPFILWFFYQFPVYSILTNLIILPFVTILTLTSILAGIAGAIYLPCGIFLIGGANYILKFYEWICRIGSKLPGNIITAGKPDLLRLILYAVLVCGFVWISKKYNKKYSVLLLFAATALLLIPQRNVGLEITFLDVGQGDAIYMESTLGTSYLIDGGSGDISSVGRYRLMPFLLSQGTDQLDYAVVTHSDSDHISGLVELMEQEKINIKTLVLPMILIKDEAYIELEALAKEKGIIVQYIQAGDVIQEGDIYIFCLHPGTSYNPTSVNSYSTVLSINYGEFDMLLTGDLQKDGELLVTEQLKKDTMNYNGVRPALNYEVLKVSHHGSKKSTLGNFLSVINPKFSVISCGEFNYYGHPHQEVLDRLEQIGSDILITYKTGAITIRTEGMKMEVNGYLENGK